MSDFENSQLQLAREFVMNTGVNIFLTGKAGTGKTTFLHTIKATALKRMIVVAPTGVAAINAGGVTIHSFFQLPFGPQIPSESINNFTTQSGEFANRYNREKINIIRTLDLLVIDEISMVRADLLDAIDGVLRRFKDRTQPFGGVQLLMIGDLQQLAPIAKEEEWELLKPYYKTPFFFSSKALHQTTFKSIELQHIYRQSDIVFIELLNKIRDNRLDPPALQLLNSRCIPNFDTEKNKGYITLTTHNHQAHRINEYKLSKIAASPSIFRAEISGNFPEYSYPTDAELYLKEGAQVMFVKNDPSREKRYYNGKIGIINNIDRDIVYVKCVGEKDDIAVGPDTWNNSNYSIDENTKEIIETVAGTFKQMPLKLAWAITIHKSQGLTFDKAIIDANAAFAHGQVYVALSRCKTLDGLVLISSFAPQSIKTDGTVLGFTKEIEINQPDEQQLAASKYAYQKSLLRELFDFNPLERKLQYCIKIARDHKASLEVGFVNDLENVKEKIEKDLREVNGKFNSQVNFLLEQEPDAEKNLMLQERVHKASQYFLDHLGKVESMLAVPFDFDTDNKEIKKILTDAFNLLKTEIVIKTGCLEVSQHGFNIKSYLEIRAKAALQPTSKKSKPSRSERDNGRYSNPKLYYALRDWRQEKAEALETMVAAVIPQKTLLEIEKKLPQTLDQLGKIKGMGKMKTGIFGTEIIELITNFCKEKGLDKKTIAMDFDAGHPEKLDTKSITLSLFRQGKSIAEIATLRQFSQQTIENHLSYYVGLGEIPIERFVSSEQINTISIYLLENKTILLSEAKEYFGEKVTWSELKFVKQYLINKGLLELM